MDTQSVSSPQVVWSSYDVTQDVSRPVLPRVAWQDLFDERQRKEIAFARVYVADFNHGTDGHNAKVIIARLADLLDQHYQPETQGA